MRRLLIILVSVGFAACTTPYAPYGCTWLLKKCVGYSQVQLAPEVYQVRFEATGSNDTRARIEDYTLLRSAELTLESGFEYFVVLQTADETSTWIQSSPGVFSDSVISCSGKGENEACVTSPGVWSGGGSYVTSLPGYAYTVKFIADPAEMQEVIVYNARTIQRDIRSKHSLPQD